MHRLLLLSAAILALVLAGCGTNNSTGLSGILLEPDLVPVAVDDDADSFKLGGSASFTVTVSNRGGAGARRHKVKAFAYYNFSNPLVCGARTLWSTDTVEIEGLDAGDAIAVKMTIDLPTTYTATTAPGFTGCTADRDYAGSWTLEVFVDSASQVIESDEGNNIFAHAFAVSGDAGSGDPGIPVNDKINN